jgi:hypothetical protein
LPGTQEPLPPHTDSTCTHRRVAALLTSGNHDSQLVDDFINSRLPLNEDVCLQLAAILVGARLGGSSLLNSYAQPFYNLVSPWA